MKSWDFCPTDAIILEIQIDFGELLMLIHSIFPLHEIHQPGTLLNIYGRVEINTHSKKEINTKSWQRISISVYDNTFMIKTVVYYVECRTPHARTPTFCASVNVTNTRITTLKIICIWIKDNADTYFINCKRNTFTFSQSHIHTVNVFIISWILI